MTLRGAGACAPAGTHMGAGVETESTGGEPRDPTTANESPATTSEPDEPAFEMCTSPDTSPRLEYVGHYMGSKAWPLSDGGQIESGRCTANRRRKDDDPDILCICFDMTCIDNQLGGTHDVSFMVFEKSVGSRLDYLVGMEVELRFQTQSWYAENVLHEVTTLRSETGRLLFAGGSHATHWAIDVDEEAGVAWRGTTGWCWVYRCKTLRSSIRRRALGQSLVARQVLVFP